MPHRATAKRGDFCRHRRTGFSILRETSFQSRRARAKRARHCSSDFRLIITESSTTLPVRALRAKYFRLAISSRPRHRFHRDVCGQAPAMIGSVMRAKLVPELVCSDFQESHRFYADLLGFRVLYSRPEERFAYLEREGA